MGEANGGTETARSQRDAAYEITGNTDALSLARDAVVLAQHPDLSCSIIDLEGAFTHETEAFSDRPGERDFLVVIAAGIVIEVADVHVLWTTNQEHQQSQQRKMQLRCTQVPADRVNRSQTYPPVRTEGRAKSGSSVWT